MKLLTAFLCLAPVGALACPPAPDHSEQLKNLSTQIQSAPDQAVAKGITDQMWRLWTDAPDQRAQDLLDAGMAHRENRDFLGAVQSFNDLVEYCPHYAEGYNQRAFARFLRQDFVAALSDLNTALDLSPNHIAALSGRALTLLALGDQEAARMDLKRATDLNPWLPERGLAGPGGPLAPPGIDI